VLVDNARSIRSAGACRYPIIVLLYLNPLPEPLQLMNSNLGSFALMDNAGNLIVLDVASPVSNGGLPHQKQRVGVFTSR